MSVALTNYVPAAFPRQTAEVLQFPKIPSRRGLESYPRTSLLGFELLRGARDEVARDIVEMAVQGEHSTINFFNAHCANLARRDRHYAAALAFSDHLLPDGSGLAFAAKAAGVTLGDNLNGTDLFPEICRHAARRGASLFLLGAEPGRAAATAAAMRSRFPTLTIGGTHSGFWSEANEGALLDEINQSGAQILLVGLGVPLQERVIARIRDRLTVPVVMGVGGLFDYYSGAIPRAPRLLREHGLEWTWRLAQEPSRLANRYLVGNPVFMAHALVHAAEVRGLQDVVDGSARRAFDFLGALAGLVAILPILLLTALMIKLEDGGPIFFRQIRIGEGGQPFGMWKFRSMVMDAEAKLAALQSERDSVCFKMRRDPRITRTGAIIRRFSIDELPQLFNILAGQMSIVGPRPALPAEVITYTSAQRGRLAGKPGLTCTWQVAGRANIPFTEQVRLDIAYLASRSLAGDLKLIFRTVPAVLSGRGAY